MAIDRMHWFTTKIIPLIYDDSLSYYEFLCKVLVKMNECIDTVNDMSAELTNFETWTTGQFEAVRQELAAAIADVESDIATLQALVNTEVTRLDGRIDSAVTDLNTTITALDTRITNQINALIILIGLVARNFADAYDSTHTYHYGDRCVYENDFYVCLSASTTGPFTGAADWRTITVNEEIENIWKAIINSYDEEEQYFAGDCCFYYPDIYRCTEMTDDPAGAFDPAYWTRTTVFEELYRYISNITRDVNALATRMNIAETAITDIKDDIATEFSVSASYLAGDYCIYQNKLYRAKNNISAGAWNVSDWDTLEIMTEVKNLNNQLGGYTLWYGTQQDYDAITTPNANTIYFVH